eukprot:NODE_1032_length_1751_cov_140.332550_g910_i0.p1 GENE.NODE_1032_length_1751_cov_140.332550_g910_i0~~NODE_1032_length_1751_cov_140.332550_g910_i0.p1  ORF type:complete len:499 (+),score=70.60 NODE_1032_length_1751_cov_140.332550_g910_i0:129-1625(+)
MTDNKPKPKSKAKKPKKQALGEFLGASAPVNWGDDEAGLIPDIDQEEPRDWRSGAPNAAPTKARPFQKPSSVALPDKPPYTLRVGGLAYAVTENELRDYFSDCGATEVRILFDSGSNQSKGFGFVTFSSRDGLARALLREGEQLSGRSIRLEVAEGKPGRDSGFGRSGGGGWGEGGRDIMGSAQPEGQSRGGPPGEKRSFEWGGGRDAMGSSLAAERSSPAGLGRDAMGTSIADSKATGFAGRDAMGSSLVAKAEPFGGGRETMGASIPERASLARDAMGSATQSGRESREGRDTPAFSRETMGLEQREQGDRSTNASREGWREGAPAALPQDSAPAKSRATAWVGGRAAMGTGVVAERPQRLERSERPDRPERSERPERQNPTRNSQQPKAEFDRTRFGSEAGGSREGFGLGVSRQTQKGTESGWSTTKPAKPAAAPAQKAEKVPKEKAVPTQAELFERKQREFQKEEEAKKKSERSKQNQGSSNPWEVLSRKGKKK